MEGEASREDQGLPPTALLTDYQQSQLLSPSPVLGEQHRGSAQWEKQAVKTASIAFPKGTDFIQNREKLKHKDAAADKGDFRWGWG